MICPVDIAIYAKKKMKKKKVRNYKSDIPRDKVEVQITY
jgi:hypothetical protein